MVYTPQDYSHCVRVVWKTELDVPYVALSAARAFKLVFQEVRVVRGGDKIVV